MTSHRLTGETLLRAGDLPVEELANIAIREGRRPRPVYQTHKWFARRFGSAFRALLVAAVTGKNDNFWTAYLGGADLTGLVVADPFVGGGTSVLEAQRLGATCMGSDVDPVAVSITGFQSRLSQVPELNGALSSLKSTVGAALAQFHVTNNQAGRPRPVLHHFWVQTLDCCSCGLVFDAHIHYQLAHDPISKLQWAICKYCGEVGETGIDGVYLSCSSCCKRTKISNGCVEYGTAICPSCGTRERLIDVAERTNCPPKYRLFALEYIAGDPSSSRPVPNSERIFKKATIEDLELYTTASKRLREMTNSRALFDDLPKRVIPIDDRIDDRLIRYGYQRYIELFNDRQLLHLALLISAIRNTEVGPLREALSIASSNHIKTNCMLTTYAFGWRRLAPLFSIRAFRHVVRPVELNPWLDGTGRGTFPNAVRRIEKANRWLALPKEGLPKGGFKTLKVQELPKMNAVTVVVSSADKLDYILNGSVDLVATDPPYFDNIAYSELSDFFLPWHAALGLADASDPGFPNARLDAKRGDEVSSAVFQDRLSRCFREIARKLKPTGVLVFTYQHKTPEGWLALASALADADLSVVRVFPMLGDTDAGPHKHDDSIRWDAVIVAERSAKDRVEGPARLSLRARFWAEGVSYYWANRLEKFGEGIFKDADRLNLRRACYAAALSHASNSANRVYDLSGLLMAPNTVAEKDAYATTYETGRITVRSDRLPAAPSP